MKELLFSELKSVARWTNQMSRLDPTC